MSDKDHFPTVSQEAEKLLARIMPVGDKCVNCGEPATHSAPKVGEPWMDRLWLFQWVRMIYSVSTRHTVVTHGPRDVCRMHFMLAEHQAKEEVAHRALAQAQVNTREAEAVHSFNRSLAERLKAAEERIDPPW